MCIWYRWITSFAWYLFVSYIYTVFCTILYKITPFEYLFSLRAVCSSFPTNLIPTDSTAHADWLSFYLLLILIVYLFYLLLMLIVYISIYYSCWLFIFFLSTTHADCWYFYLLLMLIGYLAIYCSRWLVISHSHKFNYICMSWFLCVLNVITRNVCTIMILSFAAYLYDVTESYTIVFLTSDGCGLLAAFLMGVLYIWDQKRYKTVSQPS